MGDYGFGVLVQNNTGNKSAFPVRIHPHLQAPHHHQNATASPAAFINSTPAGNGSSSGSTWLFPATGAHSNMQDEILGSEKPKAQQQELQETQEKQQQQLSPGHQESGIISELEKARAEESKVESGSSDGTSGKEKLRLESPVLTPFDYQEPSGLGTVAQSSTSSSLTSFNNWSAAIPATPSTIINEDISFFNPAASANNGPLLFQNFSHHVSPGFGGNFSPQIGPISQHHPPHPHFQHPHSQHQQHRRSPASPHQPPFPHRSAPFGQLPHLSNNLSKPPSPWGSYQNPSPSPSSTSWSPGGGYGGWGGSQGREYRRGLNGGMTPLNSISPLKKTFPNNHMPQQKYSRTSPGFNPKSWMDDSRSENVFPFQDRPRSFDGFNMHSLENSLIDIMRAEQDTLKGRLGFTHTGGDSPLPINARNYGRRRGHSSLFPMEDGFPDEERGDQSLPGLGSSHCFPHQNGERVERYSRKVFVGGLPPDIDEDEITASFRRFGHLFVDWPHKAESKSYFPPKGYAFLLFQDESSVQALIDACIEEDGKLYLCVSSPTIKDKPVQIRPWNLNDSDFVMDGSQPLDPRKTIFVGGVPRPLRAVELAMIMDRLYGGVCYAGIDTDPELKYPKGAGRVAFSNQQSYIAAISARFVQLQHGEIDKRVEVKPYVLDDQLCDECQGTRCGGKFAPFFCANVTCLQYYCEYCWAAIHSRAGREFHKPLVKEGGDRPRHISFRWN
ncbi:cytoplasmic polyadenylation element-binding protein 4-like isoform X1 [Sinocyclocheilus anshuiensis]|uniref:Cytoplasmic polyadenylation element-binding protein 4-like n=1 Tax=Sinocyclocheilus anshuiensis TaxID=1608454 RepID=A0A671QK25_9TELE|nr:PREDICTED: cytoplasmic polyadenylation element-binding protein 4-like isoform X1 [Sinocyclocheilus anshuiensis]XP_016308001.1 PREDICTED: cytoplasmic polyadenylation element-binding protein 4-like isoform X1 [Sinocyclocheilus anshuiensis]XP_016308108.1 PREDICTED: cytoplasmic polyadenylation element-binding protein 4-like isoform X1 [Sinocyclocheilus anshuiensis]XP_016308182.1 PREDICTED: cytoplasmic polyadenylation element-binding protein 4-like isoform X1 [Sinocyclocheilus anshuiensis]XP_0163